MTVNVAAGQSQSTADDPAASPCYVDRELTRNDIDGWSLRTLSLARNAIFARAGYEFDTSWLDEHFRSHEWYEPGSFQPGSISNRDGKNAKVIKKYEKSLTLDDLRARREAHWKPKGGVPQHGWLPSVWEEKEARREALLLSEAIAKRSDTLRAGIPRGFGEHFRLGGLVERLPEAFEAPSTPKTSFRAVVRDTVLHEWGSRVAAHVDSTGRLKHVTAELRVPNSETGEWDVNEDFGYLRREVRRIIDRLGEPTDPGNYREWGDVSTIKPVVWDAGSHVAEVWPIFGCCLAQDAFLSIHTDAPDRICGPEDGFDEWFDEFERVLERGQPEEIADYFHFPFSDDAGPPFSRPSIRAKMERRFESRGEFLEDVPGENSIQPNDEPTSYSSPFSLALSDQPQPHCNPYDGRSALLNGPGEYHFHRVNGEWKATEIK